MRVKNKSYKSKKQAQRKAMQLKRQDEQYKEQEMKETAQRIASYRDDEAYTQNENQDAQKRMNKLRAIPSFKITEKERDKKRKSQKRLQSEFKEKEQEKKREKRKVVENREAVFRKEQEQKEEKRKLAKEKRDALNLKRLAEKQAKKNAVYNFQQTQLKSLNEKIRNLDGKFTEHEINKFKRLREFINNFRRVPDNECVSCEGVFFAKNTHKFELEKYYFLFENVLIKDDSAKIISSINDFETFFTAKDGRICTTCANYWKEGKIPPVNLKCGLKINEIPDCIKELSDLEELLISPIIPFVQLVKTLKYAKFSQIGAKGAVVLIEPDQTVFLDLLPRNVNDMSRMCIELARRVDHKSTYAEGVVNVQKVLTALKYLVETPLFKEYNIRYDKQLLDAYDPECIKDNINFIPPSHPNINPLDKQNVKLIKKEQKKKSNQEPYEDENYSDANLIKVLLEIEEMENEKTIVREDFTLSTRDFFDDGIYYLPGDMHLYLYHMDSFNAVIHAFIGNYKINKSFKNLIDSNQNVESFQLLKNIIKARAKNEKEAIWTNYIIHKFESTFKFSKLMRLQSKDITTDPTNVLEVLLRDFPSLEIQAACDCGNVEINVNELITLLVPQSDEILSVAEDIESYLLKLKNLICQKCKKKIDQDLHAININNLIAVNYPSDVPKFVSKQYVTTNLTKIPIVIKFQNEKFNIISVIIHSLGHYTCLAFAPNFEVFKIGGSAFSSENMIRTMFLEENFGAHILLYLKNENITFEPKVENIQQQNEVYDEQNLFEEEMEIDSSIIGGGGFETLDKSAKNPNSLINFKLSDELFFNNSINYLPLNINVYHLCPFNSVFHSLIGNYHLNISFRQLINQNQNIEFFKLLKTITETHDGFKKQNLWINYIVNNKTFNNEFSFENSTNSSINVDNDITLVIQEFFRFFPSILTTTTCNCNKQDKYENEMMIVYRANRNIRQNLEFDLDKYFAELYIRNCSQCHEKIPLENNTFDFGAIISINLNFDEPAEFDKLSKEEKEKMSRQKREEYQMNLIPLQEIPKYINIRGEQFKLIAVIHNIPGHFTCYVIGANNKIIEIDDVPLHNKTRDVSLYTKVNPKVLFYMKVSIIGLNEQHVIQNEEKDAHDFSYNEVAILEDQQEQDAENEDDIREQDVDDENTLQRPINVDTLLVRKPYDAEDIIRMLEEQPEDVEKYRIAPGQFKMPLSSFNVPHYAEASFIKTFGGQLLDYDRKKISFVRRARYELRHRNRYACRTKYVLFLAKEKIKFDLMHSVQTAIRKNYKKSKITAKDVRDGKAIRNLINDNIAFHMLVTIRTAPAYFRSKSLHAMAMLRQFGMPTFFFTISPVESYAFEMMAFMKNLKRKKNESLIEARDAVLLSQDEKEQLIQEDPVTCSEVFKNKVQEFIRYANDNKGCGLFGANYVTHYTGRREYQTRGTVHAHIILKYAPILNRHLQDAEKEENERKVIEFIDRHVTTMNDEENPNHIFHHHVCNNTCFKYKKDVCRFGFPLPPMRETKILHPLTKEEKTEKVKKNFDQIRTTLKNYIKKDRPKQNFDEFLATLKMTEENYIIALRSNLKNVKILYKRSVSSVMTNSYNPTLFEIVGCNHDLQFVANEFEAITYMFKYTMKKDEGMSELLSETVKKCKEGNQDMITCLKQLTSTFYNSSFICAQQAVDEVLGHPATFFSNACQFINTNVPEKRISMRKSSKDIASMEDDDEDICKIDLIEKYANRPSDMENLTLADFVAWWAPNTKKVKDKSERDQSSDDEDSSNSDNEEKKESKMHIIPQYNQSGKYKKRRQPRVIRFVNFKKEKDMANYKREQCMLYYPWRSEETELLNSEAVTARFQAHYGEIIANAAQYSKYTVEELEILRQEVEESLEKEKQAEREQFKREELPEDERIDLGEEIDSVGVKKTKKTSSNIPPYKISYPDLKKKSEIYENLRSANEKQQEICLHLMNKMRRRKPNEPAEMIIVMGSAGVGKSWTINLITQLYNDYYNEFKTTTNENADKPKVLLMGPTGSCAFLINGNTIHSALSIAPRRDYMELGSDTLNTIRSELLDIETVIIDEISMVGCEMRKMVDRRLRQIFNHDEPFGGRNILLFGDLYQLEPVAQKKIFEQTNEGKKNNDVRDYIEEVLTWQQFKFFELTEIVRQKNKDFQEALNHCARGTMTKKHIDLLRTREVTEDQVPVDAFRLFPTNSQVNEYNQKRMQQCPHPLFEVDAIDTIEGKDLSAKEKKTLLDTYQDDVIPETNLVFRVPLKITIRYRIVVNVNVSDGIVNGALGTLMHITFDHQNNPLTLWIRFDNDRVGKKARAEFAEDKKVIITDVKIQADWTPIKRYKTNMTSFKPKIIHEAFRDQFPVLPAEASTIHKSQGQTLSKVCVDFRSGLLKSNDQIYVAISRCDLENLYILGEFKSGSKNLEIDREIRRLRTKAPLQLSYYNFTQIIGSKIIYHNIASFNKYKEDLKRIRWYQKADILVFAEAGVSKIEPDDIHQSFTVIYPTPATTPEQENDNNAISRYLKLKGIIILAKDPSVIKDFTSYNAMTGVNVYNEPWHIDLNTFITDNHFIITGYKSPKVPSGIFITALEEMFKKGKTSNLPIVVIGDFNFDMKKTNVFNSLLLEKGLSNCLGEEKTRETDTQIDIVYSSSPNGHAGVFASHISDHFAVFYQTQYDKNLEVKKRKEIKKEPDDDDENAVQPAKKAKVQKEEIDPSELKFSLFPNSTQAISDDINIKVINLDVHNALAHSFVALYKMFDSKDLNQIPFFRDLPDILKLPKNEQINRYILIVETSDKERFICREEGICNIKGKVETVLKGFLGNYKSIESRKPCTARGCNHIGFEKPFLTIAQKINNVSKEELEKVIEKAIESDRCTACNRMNKKPGYRSYSPLLFIHKREQ
ncbi:hypothetical protein PVAND_005392 [Polypedilum vanderplanki]|uniref:ATP-dependent DNA helicase n=1 Tax=Polypedilum vanderplanki TaxID=319348 RepID=A0A9J6C0R2_POLVA|nr:hypothetical protein PVAND_005392 [Polypedilum vanderplanki]